MVDSVRAETGVLWREEERRSRLVLREPEGLFLEAAEGIVRSLAMEETRTSAMVYTCAGSVESSSTTGRDGKQLLVKRINFMSVPSHADQPWTMSMGGGCIRPHT